MMKKNPRGLSAAIERADCGSSRFGLPVGRAAFALAAFLFSIHAAAQVSPASHPDNAARASQPAAAAPVAAPSQADSDAPPAPPAPKDAPIKPPQVTCTGGELTIVAENSLLSEILMAVHTCTHADIDLAPGANAERFWAHLGPGPSRKILAQLLNDSKYDYLIMASDTNPDGIRSVFLSPRTEAPTTQQGTKGGNSVAAAIRSMNQRGQAYSPGLVDLHSTGAISADSDTNSAPVAVPAPASAPADAAATAPADPNAAANGANAGTGANTAATAPSAATDASQPSTNSNSGQNGNLNDRMMQMLQNMYEERKNQMQQVQQKPSGQN